MSGMHSLARQLHGVCVKFIHPGRDDRSIVAKCVSKCMYLWPRLHFAICKTGICLLSEQYAVLTLASGTRRLRSNSQLTSYFWRAKMGLTMVSIGYQKQTVYKWHLATANYSQLQFRCSRNGGCQVFDFAPNI